jgi:hypothetical protein
MACGSSLREKRGSGRSASPQRPCRYVV